MNAGTRVKKARLQAGLTQSELAGENYSAAYVSIIESGKREPSERVLKSFAERLGITYEELATGRPPDAEAALEEELLSARRQLFAGDVDGAAATYRRISRRAGQFELVAIRGRAQVGEAFCVERAGDFDGAAKLYERLLDELPEEHAAERADAVTGRARCVTVLGDLPYATYLLESFLSDLRRNHLVDPDALLRIQTSLVAVYFQGGLLKQAALAADEALGLQSKARDAERVAGMHINVARVLMERGKYAAAARSFRAAEKTFGELRLEGELGLTFLARSFLMKKQERFDDARSDLEEARGIFEANGDEPNEARVLSELGGLERLAGNTEQAVFTLERAARMALKNQPVSAAVSYRELALCHTALGQTAKAKTSFKKAVDLLEGSGNNYELAVTYRAWGDALRDKADYKSACDVYRLAAVALEEAA